MQIILHIGTWKTGSSAIQLFMARNAKRLAKQGVYLPSVVHKDNGHTLLFRALCQGGPEQNALLDEFRAIERNDADARLFISSEHFWPLSSDEIRDLASVLHQITDDIRVLVYLRPQDEMWASVYAQQAKSFRVRPESPVWGTADFIGHGIRNWALYYNKCLSMFEDAFGEGSVSPRLYRRQDFPEGDVIFDFLDFTGVMRDPAFERHEGDTNPSFGWKSVAMSLWFVGAVYDDIRKFNELPDMRRAFRAGIGEMHARRNDPDWLGRAPVVLSGQDRRDIRAHYGDDNNALFTRYFQGMNVFGDPENSVKDQLDHASIPEREFDLARRKILKHFRRAQLNLRGTEAAFRAPTPLSLAWVRSRLAGTALGKE